ncbi:glycosyl transferase family 2 [Bacillaceae bacterium SAOS 7]|nr:glycosyl transferase family 2 [Bacillaceae bacterium SAOS 7]
MYTIVTTGLVIFVLWTWINAQFLPKLPQKAQVQGKPLVSVLVPLRNEERNAKGLVQSLQSLTYPHLEFILLDDQSTDQTLTILQETIGQDRRFQLLTGKELPPDWVGKVYACHQLQQQAKGDYFLFIDADVRLKPSIIKRSLTLLQQKNAKLLTGFSAFEVPSFLNKLLVPMQHFVVLFHLPIVLANYTNLSATTAAHGAFMLFERTTYQKIGGHQAVRASLVEDVHFARQLKKQGERVLLANITEQVICRMYETNREAWEGFLKNIYIGLGRSPLLVFCLTLFYSVFYIIPLIWLIYGLVSGQWLYCIPYLLTVLQRFYVDKLTNQRKFIAWLMPLSALAFIAIMHASMCKSWLKQSYQWKGRQYS